jgi:hypothetical protein
MAYLDQPETAPPPVSPQLLVGAASPLWSYFGAAAAGGVAFWWMTRWTQPVNLEALFDAATRAMRSGPQLTLKGLETAEAVVEAAPSVEAPVGGEAAPISPVAAAVDTPVETVTEAAEAAVQAPAQAMTEVTEAALDASQDIADAIAPATEAAAQPMIEAAEAVADTAQTAADSLAPAEVPPPAKPRVRRGPPAADEA